MSVEKIIRLLSLLVAVVLAFVSFEQTPFVLAISGLLLGFLGVDNDRKQVFLISVIALSVVKGSLDAIPGIGTYLTSILINLSHTANAAGVVVILRLAARQLSK